MAEETPGQDTPQPEPEPQAAPEASATPAAELSLLERIVQEGHMAREESQKPYARDLISELVTQVLDEGMTVRQDTVAAINARIAEIDALISSQLNAIMHDEAFQTLEASWRGLHALVMQTETSTRLKLRLLPATKKELLADLEKAIEFDQSTLFKKLYEEEYGTFGGHPYGLLLGDYEFSRHPQDMALLEKLSNVAAAAHAPFIAGAHPRLFDLDRFTELSGPRDLAKIFESTELIKWRSFRDSEDARYVALVLPHVLLRLPYGPDTVPVEGCDFVEDVDGTDHRKYLWGNAVYSLGQRITNAFALYSWCGAIRGVEGGGLVEGLPAHTFRTGEGDIVLKTPTEVSITDRREKELSDLGFISLCHCKGTDVAAFFGGQTANKAKVYDTPQATANARISAQLPYMLAASRFAHYLKAMMRDKIGSFMTAGNVSAFLNRWITNYVLLDDEAGQESKARYPLREARVDVTEIPGKPGAYKATVFLRPHFQLDELTASIRLVAELPAPAA
jgi:type VI secretion system protein ImpC